MKIRFTKPLKRDPRCYLDSREIVRWGSIRDGGKIDWRYVITRDCKAYYLPELKWYLNGIVSSYGSGAELVAEYHDEKLKPEDNDRRSSWGTHPRLQRSYTKLYELCRKDWQRRQEGNEN